MAFDEEELGQLRQMFEEFRSVMTFDMKAAFRADLARVEAKIDRLFVTESQDVTAVARDVDNLKKRVRKIEMAHGSH